MRCFSWWMAFGVLLMSSAAAVAQQQSYYPITPNYGRYATQRVAWQDGVLPSPQESAGVVGSGSVVSPTAPQNASPAAAENLTIPQQGSVDLGVPSYGYGGPVAVPMQPGAVSLPSVSASIPDYAYGDFECQSCGAIDCDGGCTVKKHRGWFGGAYYMHLWRDDDRFGFPLATATTDPSNTVLASGFAHMKDSPGLGVRVGKMLSPCCAVEGIYWQVFPDDNPASAHASVLGDTINSSILFTGLTYDNLGGGGPVPVDNFFQNSQYMSVTRTYDYRNFEVNFLRLPYTFQGCDGKARLALLAGARYFQGKEGFELYSDSLNEVRGDDPANELLYKNDVENHLVGFQVGGVLSLCCTKRLSGQFGTKVGIFNNHMKQFQGVASAPGGGGGAIIAAGPDAGQAFALESKKDDVAFLGEFDAGLAYCISPCWRVTGGYKVLAISGYADSLNQIPYTFTNLSTNGLIQDNNSLILHGIYVGAEYSW